MTNVLNFHVVWNPWNRRYKGMDLPKQAICANDGTWYCDNYRILTPSEVLEQIIETTKLTDTQKHQRVQKVVSEFNRILARIDGRNAALIETKYDTVFGEKYVDLNAVAADIWTQECKNKRIFLPCIAIHRRIVKSHRIEWVPDYIVGAKSVDAILDLVYKYDLEPDYRNKTTVEQSRLDTRALKKRQVKVIKVAKVSDKDANFVSQNPDGRGIKEFIPHAHAWGGTRPTMKEYTSTEVVKIDKKGNVRNFKDDKLGYFSAEDGHSDEYNAELLRTAKLKKMPEKFNLPKDKPEQHGYIDIYQRGANTNRNVKPEPRAHYTQYQAEQARLAEQAKAYQVKKAEMQA